MVTTNGHSKWLVPLDSLPAKAQEDFDYIEDDERFSERLFRYRGYWYDAHEFVRIKPRSQAVGWEHGADEDSELLAWDGIQTDSFYSAIVVRLLGDGDRIVAGTYTC
jgi:hypothetical protein